MDVTSCVSSFQGGRYLERELIALHEDADGVSHELVGHLENLMRESGGHENHLGGDECRAGQRAEA